MVMVVENRALVLRTRNPEKFSIIPKSKYLGESEPGIHEVAVFWSLDEARVLKNLGVRDVPSPILGQYDWPGRYKPMEHQKETAAFLTMNKRAFVLSDPGTGKTLSALWAADYLMQKKQVRRVLILAPLSILHSAWLGDIGQSIIHRSAIIAHHAQAVRRVEMIQSNYEIVIMNYDGLPLVADEIIKDGRFDLVIVDEANAVKSASTRRWKTLNRILRPDTYLWMMTGTPAAQSPLDAYGLAKLVNPQSVPFSFTGWRDKVMNKVTMFKWVPKPDAKQTVYKALQPSIRFTKDQCLDLPPVVFQTREVDMTAQQMKYYKLLKEQLLVQAAGETISAVNAAAGLNKLLQISSGAAYSDDREVVEFDCTPRLNVLLEILEETDRKVLIFCMFRSIMDTIFDFLKARGQVVEQIHGDVTATKRADIINRFQTQPEPRVLVMQPQATAHGITLTAADTVVFYGPLMSVEQYWQAIARTDRKGQDSDKVRVIHIESSPVEKKMFKALQEKVGEHLLLTSMFDHEVRGK
jgi:SNF2 family DNA or RNA helicase